MEADAVVVGAGLAGLVATAELAEAGRRVILLEQEPEASFGGQAWWSFGGLFLIDSPEQRRLRVHDSLELARQDWFGTAGFDRTEDHWPRKWAEAYLQFAAGEKRAWLKEQGVGFFPVVGWAERGGYTATGHGNSVPRFHIVWGTGPGIVEPFARRVRAAVDAGRLDLRFRHRVSGLVVTDGAVTGVRGAVLESSGVGRGEASSRTEIGDFEIAAQAVVVTSGGIGGNHELVRTNWPARLGPAPRRLLSGVPAHVDGHMLEATQDAGASVVNEDRMWHYPEGIANHSPVWSKHGIRILTGPSPLWLDADGGRLPSPLFPGFDALGALQHVTTRGDDHSWFVLNKTIMEKEFALSGSEQNPDLTGKSVPLLVERVRGKSVPVRTFAEQSEEFLWASTPAELAAKMNALTEATEGSAGHIDAEELAALITARDAQVASGLGKDPQVVATSAARHFIVDKAIRVSPPRALTDPQDGPLLAVRLTVLTRKTLGGIWCDETGRALTASGDVLEGLWAVGEAAGFGGGGSHGHRALEGTFLGGCLFTGRTTGRALAAAL